MKLADIAFLCGMPEGSFWRIKSSRDTDSRAADVEIKQT